MVLEVRSLRAGCRQGPVRALFWAHFLSQGKGQGLSLGPIILRPISWGGGLCPHNLIASPRSHFLTSSPLGVRTSMCGFQWDEVRQQQW